MQPETKLKQQELFQAQDFHLKYFALKKLSVRSML
jgi:hypothetical protein